MNRWMDGWLDRYIDIMIDRKTHFSHYTLKKKSTSVALKIT